MCGIAGIIAKQPISIDTVLQRFVKVLHHRGPDAHGYWKDSELGIGLAHVRLSILDLSAAGNQPMKSISGRYILVFNGEIYNHKKLRKTLNEQYKVNWIGESDTETLVQAFESWGVTKTINLLVGMFAIALWDSYEQKLILIRDRMGEKPLYYGWVNSNFVFASDLDAITSVPGFPQLIDRDALALYIKYGSVPEPYSIYQDVFKLESGHILTFDFKTHSIQDDAYWDLNEVAEEFYHQGNFASDKDAIEKLDFLLKDAIEGQMQSDVPLGAFLSGGVDSSTIAAIMQAISPKKINTFSIGFDQKEYNEAEFAKSVAQHLGTDHHETYVTGKDALSIVPKLSKIYSEPFADPSQIPTFLITQIAKRSVTVCLTGDGGDELFCGYKRYQLSQKIWNKLNRSPRLFRKFGSSIIHNIPYDFWYYLLLPLKGRKDGTGKALNFADKLLKGTELLSYSNRQELYHKGFMGDHDNLSVLIQGSKHLDSKYDQFKLNFDSYYEEMMLLDLMTYLPNDNLVKVDRAAMANSLETRVPLLDKSIVEFALSIPMHFKLRDGIDKWILREVLYQYVPKELIERPKMGFAVPMRSWLRGPLKSWAEELISPQKLREGGFFNFEIIQKKWQEHQSGKRNWEGILWKVLVFQDWYLKKQNFSDGSGEK